MPRRFLGGVWGLLLVSVVSCPGARVVWKEAENPFPPPATGAGSSDSSFGASGIVVTEFADGGGEIHAMTLYPMSDSSHPGKILVAGTVQRLASKTAAIARYHTDGSLDTTFAADAEQPGVRTIIVDQEAVAYGVEILSGGNILVSGEGLESNLQEAFLLKLDPTGTLIPGFGSAGMVRFHFLNGGRLLARNAVVDPQSRYLISGTAENSQGFPITTLSRLSSIGAFDFSYGTTGFRVSSANFSESRILQVGSDTFVAGSSDGSLNLGKFPSESSSFQSAGVTGSLATGRNLVRQANGVLLVVGDLVVSGQRQFLLARWRDDLDLDLSFDIGGGLFGNNVKVGFDGVACQGNAVAEQTDGKLVVTGSMETSGQKFMGLARLTGTGAMDTSFGTGGRISLEPSEGTENSEINAVSLQEDGKILVAGYAIRNGKRAFALARLASE